MSGLSKPVYEYFFCYEWAHDRMSPCIKSEPTEQCFEKLSQIILIYTQSKTHNFTIDQNVTQNMISKSGLVKI